MLTVVDLKVALQLISSKLLFEFTILFLIKLS